MRRHLYVSFNRFVKTLAITLMTTATTTVSQPTSGMSKPHFNPSNDLMNAPMPWKKSITKSNAPADDPPTGPVVGLAVGAGVECGCDVAAGLLANVGTGVARGVTVGAGPLFTVGATVAVGCDAQNSPCDATHLSQAALQSVSIGPGYGLPRVAPHTNVNNRSKGWFGST
jgi:hypothetical protein